MSKRHPRSEANETATVGEAASPAQPKNRRARSGGNKPATAAPTPIQPADTFAARAGATDQPSTDASSSGTRSDSMASEPSEEAIRLRAYQRYLERGAGDGRHFEDWLEAERELKGKQQR